MPARSTAGAFAWSARVDGRVCVQDRGRMFVERFLTKLSLLLRGTTVAPAARFGETLAEERAKGGSFSPPDATAVPSPRLTHEDLRLYGGAQFNRAMAEFRCARTHAVRARRRAAAQLCDACMGCTHACMRAGAGVAEVRAGAMGTR
jgi:hypothetical protein